MRNAGGLLHSRGAGLPRRQNRTMVMPELAYQNEQFYPHGLKSISKGVPLASLHASGGNLVDCYCMPYGILKDSLLSAFFKYVMLLALTCWLQHSPCSEKHRLAVLVFFAIGAKIGSVRATAELMSAPCAITSMHSLTLMLAVEVVCPHIVLSRQPNLTAPLHRDAVCCRAASWRHNGEGSSAPGGG